MSKILGAVEIGTHKAKAMVGVLSPSGDLKVVAAASVKNEGVRKGEIVDYRKTASAVHAAIEEAEKAAEAKIDEVSRQFEAVILRNFLKDSLKPVFKTYLNKENSQNSIYRYHLVDSLAESMSERQALGISNILQMQLKSTLSSKGSTETAK